MGKDCIFCKIVQGKVPCTKIFETDFVLAFLDIYPGAYGHTLVVPKEHSANLLEVKEKHLQEILSAVKKVGQAQMDALGAQGFNVLQSNNSSAGQVVFHTHFHVFPRKQGDDLNFKWQPMKADEKYLKEVSENLEKYI